MYFNTFDTKLLCQRKNKLLSGLYSVRMRLVRFQEKQTVEFSKNQKALVPQRAMSLNPSGRQGGQGRRRSTIFDDMAEIGKKGKDLFGVQSGATQIHTPLI